MIDDRVYYSMGIYCWWFLSRIAAWRWWQVFGVLHFFLLVVCNLSFVATTILQPTHRRESKNKSSIDLQKTLSRLGKKRKWKFNFPSHNTFLISIKKTTTPNASSSTKLLKLNRPDSCLTPKIQKLIKFSF